MRNKFEMKCLRPGCTAGVMAYWIFSGSEMNWTMEAG
jgi:hypothetical protein